AIHVDGTARPQVIRPEENPGYYRVVRLYFEKTGIPSLINTSFNMHEEPIVCTPADACRALIAARLPYLAMNRFLAVGSTGEFPAQKNLPPRPHRISASPPPVLSADGPARGGDRASSAPGLPRSSPPPRAGCRARPPAATPPRRRRCVVPR